MKRTLMILTAVLFCLASCSKGNIFEGTPFNAGQEVILSFSTDNMATKVTGSAVAGSTTFVWDDQDAIKVTVGGKSARFVLLEGAGTNSGKFSGTMPANGSVFDVEYPFEGAADLSEQTYVKGKVPNGTMGFKATGCTLDASPRLLPTNALLRFDFTGGDIVSKIVVETVDAATPVTYTLSIDPAVKLSASPETFLIVTDKINEKLKVTLYDNSATPAKIREYTTANKQDLITNDYVSMPEKLVKGPDPVFSVSSSKKVLFTKGNLYWDGSAFHIEASQTGYQSTWNTSYVSLFYWTKVVANSYKKTYNDGKNTGSDVVFFAENNGGMAVDGQSGLYVLSSTEWNYLINSRTNATSLVKKDVTVGTVDHCLIIAPDGYKTALPASYTELEWAAAEAAGVVCLPPAGLRLGDSFAQQGSRGYYWSSSVHDSNNAKYLYFTNEEINPVNYAGRERGFSLRLVKTATE